MNVVRSILDGGLVAMPLGDVVSSISDSRITTWMQGPTTRASKLLRTAVILLLVSVQPPIGFTQAGKARIAGFGGLQAQTRRYFPAGVFDLPGGPPSTIGTSLATQLRAVAEPSLFDEADDPSVVQTYRFILLGAPSGKTAIFRLNFLPDGSGRLFTKIVRGDFSH
jgi:hypothetical protein